MIELVLAEEDCRLLRAQLVGKPVETCAILFASQVARPDGVTRLLVRDMRLPEDADYSRRGPLIAELTPAFVAAVSKIARREGHALVFVHSHLGLDAPVFSDVDNFGEERLARFLEHRHPARMHSSLVISGGGACSRRLGTHEYNRVIAIGDDREVVFDPTSDGSIDKEQFDRQVRAFGEDGQKRLGRLRIAIVGLGGVGSIVAQQIVHLGVREFILIDPDIIESSNLNRVANATPADVGKPKVDVAERYIGSVAPAAIVESYQADITRAATARRLLNADLIFGCTDSHGSRAVLQQVAYQYFIPCIDMGTTIAVSDGRITHIYGRVQLLAPGLACLTCSGLLNPNEVRHDMMTEFERRADPYLQGSREPAPAVMSLNSTVASLAVTMTLSAVCQIPVAGRYLLYNAMSSSLRKIQAAPNANCYICSHSGSLARGDGWPLLARQD